MMKSQRGITISGFIFFIAIFVYGVILAMRFVPVYVQEYNLKNTLKALRELPKGYLTGSALEDSEYLRNRFMNQLSIDGIEGFKKTDLVITPDKNSYDLGIQYERRIHLVANIDAVVTFNLHETVNFRVE